MKCPECEEEIKPLNMEDEDSCWSECPECHATWGYSIKPA